MLYASTTERQRSLVQLYSTCGGGVVVLVVVVVVVVVLVVVVVGDWLRVYDLRCDPVELATVCPLSMATGSLSTM